MLQVIDQLSSNRLRDWQTTFDGGMRRDIDPSKLEENEYTLLINGRNRNGTIQPVKLPTQITDGVPPSISKFQGLYAADSYVILFAAGKAYFRNYLSEGTGFAPVPGAFEMSPVADTLFAELVPASTINFTRSISDVTDKFSPIELVSATSGSPQALIVQDKINQPRLILADGTSRLTQTFAQWTLTNREYVPVGGAMMMGDDGKLYIISPSGREIYHSVTGRPLDFIIAVDANANKLATEAEADANALAYRPDYDPITAITKQGSADSFYIGTSKNSYLIKKTGRLIYGEPVFARQFLFSTGPLNNFSIADILGDTALVDFSGIRSFNAVLQDKNEGRNLPFSKEIFRLIEGITQTSTAAITFDNYALFSVTTVYGPAILVYDTLLAKWVAVDIYPGVGLVKQFCEVKLPTGRFLFFITTDNKLYQAFAGNTATVSLYTKEFCTNDPEIQHKVDFLKTVFTDITETGTVTVTPLVDRKAGSTSTKPLTTANGVPALPMVIPFGSFDKDVVDNETHKFMDAKQGFKTGFLITWNCDAQLSHISVVAVSVTGDTTLESQAKQAFIRS
jgi:hypothetical protein